MRIFDRFARRVTRIMVGDDYDRSDGRCRQSPQWLVLVINNFCNLKCKMCDVGLGATDTVFYDHLIGDNPRNMPPELLATILEQAAGFVPKPKIGLAYTEPLIHRDVLRLCEMIVEARFFCSITTNGFMLPRLADDLVGIDVDEITVSVDGPEAVHDSIRGRQGSFRNLYEGVERLNAAKSTAGQNRPHVRFSYTLTDENYTHMVAFVEQIEDLQPASLAFSHLNFISAEMAEVHNAQCETQLSVSRSNIGTMELDTIDIDSMWQALSDLKAYAAAHTDFPPYTIVPDFRGPDGLETYYRRPLTFVGGRNCTDPWHMLMIKTDGTVIPAHGRCYDVPVGNVHEIPLPILWNNGTMRAFRQTLKDAGGALPACARCCGVIGKSD